MKHLIKIAGAALLAGIIIFLFSKNSNSEKEVIIKVKASRSASYTHQPAIAESDKYIG